MAPYLLSIDNYQFRVTLHVAQFESVLQLFCFYDLLNRFISSPYRQVLSSIQLQKLTVSIQFHEKYLVGHGFLS